MLCERQLGVRPARVYIGPRRLAVVVEELPERTPDEWVKGPPEHLREQMARLARLAHRIVWLNPLQESPEYEPLARGMAAALPYVGVFASGHNLASLEELGSQLG